jgi:hypothetical protein
MDENFLCNTDLCNHGRPFRFHHKILHKAQLAVADSGMNEVAMAPYSVSLYTLVFTPSWKNKSEIPILEKKISDEKNCTFLNATRYGNTCWVQWFTLLILYMTAVNKRCCFRLICLPFTRNLLKATNRVHICVILCTNVLVSPERFMTNKTPK